MDVKHPLRFVAKSSDTTGLNFQLVEGEALLTRAGEQTCIVRRSHVGQLASEHGDFCFDD